MKLQHETLDGVNQITRCDEARVVVGSTAFEHSLVVPWIGPVQRWPAARFEDLRSEHFEQLVALRPELVIFGSGERLRFAHPALLHSLIEHRIGVECMDTRAACRTYNVLVSEQRSVVAALIVGSGE